MRLSKWQKIKGEGAASVPTVRDLLQFLKDERRERIKAIEQSLRFTSSTNRLGTTLNAVKREPADVFWPIFLIECNGTDNTWFQRVELLQTLRRRVKQMYFREFLSPYARKVFDNLPQLITVYRGGSRPRRRGLSWTLSKRVAGDFARGHRGRGVPDASVFQARIPKQAVLAIFTDRKEHEVLLDPTFLQDIVEIDFPPPPRREAARVVSKYVGFFSTIKVDLFSAIDEEDTRCDAVVHLLQREQPDIFWRVFLRTWVPEFDRWPSLSRKVLRVLRRQIKRQHFKPFLDRKARQLFETLPRQITVYRGARQWEKRDMAWSTSKATAVNIAREYGPQYQPDVRVFQAAIPKRAILAYFSECSVHELLIDTAFLRRIAECEP